LDRLGRASGNYAWTPIVFLGIAMAIGGNVLVLRR